MNEKKKTKRFHIKTPLRRFILMNQNHRETHNSSSKLIE